MSMTDFINNKCYHYAAIPDKDNIPVPVRGRLLGYNLTPKGSVGVFLPDGCEEPTRLPENRIKKTKEQCQVLCNKMIKAYIKNHERRLEILRSLLPPSERPMPKPITSARPMREIFPETDLPERKSEKPKDNWISIDNAMPTWDDIKRHDGRILVTDGRDSYQRLYDPKKKAFYYLKYDTGVKHHMDLDTHVIAWQPMPTYIPKESEDTPCTSM